MQKIDLTNPNLYNTFVVKKRKRCVYYHDGIIILDCEKSHSYHKLTLEDVICVNYGNSKGEKTNFNEIEETDNKCFTIYYGKQGSKNKWKLKSVTFHHNISTEVDLWVKTLRNNLNDFKCRPKKLLLFVNPFGGKKNAVQIFEKYGKTLFNLAGINVTVIVTQHADEIRDCIMSLHLYIYDAIACVGGDGTFSEVFNGLILRTCREQHININDINAVLPTPQIPVGVIPAGSTNTIAYCMHGTIDVTTSVLKIIYGNTLGLDLVSVYNEQQLLRLYGSVISYGYLGDVLFESEKHRWMGPKRYEYSGFKKFMLNSGYNVELAYCVDENEQGKEMATKCFGKCDKCKENGLNMYRRSNFSWKIIKGRYFMISGANISCACDRSPNGLSPNSHLGDGNINLLLVKHTNVLNNLRLLATLANKKKNIEDLPFVDVHQTKEFCFRVHHNTPKTVESQVLPRCSKWNCDGEIIQDTNLRVKVRSQLLNVFSRGSKHQEKTATCC